MHVTYNQSIWNAISTDLRQRTEITVAYSSNLSVFFFHNNATVPVLRPCWPSAITITYNYIQYHWIFVVIHSVLSSSCASFISGMQHLENVSECFASQQPLPRALRSVLEWRAWWRHPLVAQHLSPSLHLHQPQQHVLRNSKLPAKSQAKGWQLLQRLISSDQWGSVVTAAIFKGLSLSELQNRCWHMFEPLHCLPNHSRLRIKSL